MTQELVVVSGKGGTGKTSLTASFAVLAGRSVVADCDVDAADLFLVLSPRPHRRQVFRSGREARVRPAECQGCGTCEVLCRYGAVTRDADGVARIDPVACEGCGVCVQFCPAAAIDFLPRVCGEWLVSSTRCGPMVHARLGAAAENSGKLVATVRREAHGIAEPAGLDLLLVDGPPGVGCPVIASVTGASHVLVVTEPSLSGEHDLKRVLALTRHFAIPTSVCVNRWDINPDRTLRIESTARDAGARPVGRVRHDRGVTAAQLQARAVVETATPAAVDIREVWQRLGDLVATTTGETRCG